MPNYGLVDCMMKLCEVTPEEEFVASLGNTTDKLVCCKEGWYTIRELKDGESGSETYFPGRMAEILLLSPKKRQVVCIPRCTATLTSIIQRVQLSQKVLW